jgi:hypothetical protein
VGLNLNMTAYRTEDARALADALLRYSADHAVPAEIVESGAETTRDAARIAPPQGGWSVIDWPRHFARQATTSRWLSEELGLVASSVHVFESDVWSHVVYQRGETRDRFSSNPRYHTRDLEPLAEAKRRWTGNPAVVAALFGSPERDIAAYFVQPSPLRTWWTGALGKGYGKAFADDTSHLDDEWLFVDFWRRIGIEYPDGRSPWAHVVQWHPPGSDNLPYIIAVD